MSTPLATANVAAPAERVPIAYARAPGTLRVADGTIEAMKWLAVVLMAIDHMNKYLAGGKVA